MTSGYYGSGTGLVVLTDRRLFFLKDGWLNQTSENFPLERVSSIQWSAGVFHGSIIVFASGNKAEIKQVIKSDGKDIVDLVRARLTGGTAADNSLPPRGLPAHVPAVPAYRTSTEPTTDSDTVFHQLRQLGELRDSGVVTQEEFDTKKAELLARLQ